MKQLFLFLSLFVMFAVNTFSFNGGGGVIGQSYIVKHESSIMLVCPLNRGQIQNETPAWWMRYGNGNDYMTRERLDVSKPLEAWVEIDFDLDGKRDFMIPVEDLKVVVFKDAKHATEDGGVACEKAAIDLKNKDIPREFNKYIGKTIDIYYTVHQGIKWSWINFGDTKHDADPAAFRSADDGTVSYRQRTVY